MTTSDTQKNKEIVWSFWQKLTSTESDSIADVIQSYVHKDISWCGPHPINQLQGTDALVSGFWRPLLRSFPDIRRNSYVFMGGPFEDKDWVCAAGCFTGTFAGDWLGIPATGRETNIRFGEFCCLKEDKIAETYILLDLIDVMLQAGYRVLPPSPGDENYFPRPSQGDGLLLTPQDDLVSEESLQLVEEMLDGLGKYNGTDLGSMNMATYWHPQMHWYGPCGIGTACSLKEYEEVHARPFLHAFPDRKGAGHKARVADGHYVASTGWPSVLATHAQEYLGCPATGKRVGMRVMDWWRCEGDLLVENWVFIDMIDLFLQLGVDIFEMLNSQT